MSRGNNNESLETISNREFARRLEKEGFAITEAAIRDLKKKNVFTVDSKNKLKWPTCKEEYFKNVDLSQRRNFKNQAKVGNKNTKKENNKESLDEISIKIAESLGINKSDLLNLPDFMKVKTLREVYLAQKEKIELSKLQNKYYEKSEVDTSIFEITNTIKSSLFNLSKISSSVLSAKFKEKYKIEIKPREISIMLDEAFRQHLKELSENL